MAFRGIQSTNIISTDVGLTDPLLILNKDGSTAVDVGFLGKIGATSYAGLVKDSATDGFILVGSITLSPNTVNDISALEASLVEGDLTAGSITATSFTGDGSALTGITDTDTTYTAGTNVTISGSNVISATDTNTTYVDSDWNHDSLTGFVANEHIDWTTDQGATNIHTGNYTNDDTIYTSFNTDFDTRLATKSTTNLAEGTNLYYTDARARQAISVSGDLSYNSTTGVISSSGLASSTTDDLAEGSTNLYYTDARADARIDNWVGLAPTGLDTLVELSTALGNDVNFSTTITNSLANKEPTITAGTTAQYWRGDKSFQTLDTSVVTENTNLYYTDTRVRGAISVSGDLSYNSSTGVISTQGLASSTTDNLAEGTTNLYYTTTRTNTDFDTRLATKSTTNLAEGTNLYWTTARGQSMFDTRLATKSTTNLAEGSNLYYTTARDTSQFNTDLATKDTDDLAEGSNLYWTTSRGQSMFDTRLATKDTDDLAEGSNLYYTTARDTSQFNTDLATKSTTNLAEGSNLYYTDARAEAVSINNLVEDTTPQLGGNLDLNTYDLTTTDPTVTLTTTATSTTAQGTVGASSETNLSNTAVTVNTDDSDVGNAVSSYITLSSTEITNLGFEGDISLTYFGAAAPTSNFVWRDAGDSAEQNDMVVVYSPPTDEYTFTLPTNVSLPTNSTLPFNSLDNDIYFKQYAYGEMTVTSATTLTGSTIQLRDANGFYIDKEHVTVASLGASSYKIVFWTHDVSAGDVIDVIAASAQTATFEWGTSSFSETGLVATAESFSLLSSTNDIFAMGDLEFTTGNVTGEVVGTLIYDSPSNNTIISGLTTVTIDGTGYQSALTVTDVPMIMTGNAGTTEELTLVVGSATDARLWLIDSSGNLIYKLPAADGTANQVMKTDGSGDISWTSLTTDDIPEGSTNLYYTDARWDIKMVAASTSDLSEGTNLYYTDSRADARAQLKIDALVDSAPGALDTLNELAAALGDDANYSTTVTNLVSANTTLIGNLTHDGFADFVANEHIDWSSASAGTIHASNYTNTNTTYTAGTGLTLVGTEFSNTAPDQTVSLTGTGATSITGTYPNFTIDSTNSTTDITGSIIPATDDTYDLGSSAKKYSNIYGHSVHATYADLAERYATDVPYESGTVVVFGGEAEITVTSESKDVSVAGVISTNPALKLNADAGNSETHPYVALKGRVPCKLIGPVSKGDLIVTADNEPGYAQSIGKNDAGHSVFAKSIETDLTVGKKLIEVVIL